MNTGDKVLSHLQGFGLKPEGQGKWRCNSPLRPGANSHSFTVDINPDGESGLWCDHADGGKGGTLYELADLLGIGRPKSDKTERAQVEDSKRAYKNLAEYALLKGVPESAFIEAGWHSELVTYDKRPAITFQTQSGMRYRFIDGQKPPFKSETGYKACWYGLTRAIALATEKNLPLVMCNGEPSTIVGQHFGVPACCITGGEQATFPPDLLTELQSKWKGEVIVAMDCDDAGRKSAAGKSAILRRSGFTVHNIDLGLSDKGDLADLCKLYTESSMAHLQTLIPAPTAQTPMIDPTGAAPIKVVKRADLLSDYLTRISDFETPRTAVPVPFPLTTLHTFGGMARVIKPGKMVGIVSVSGGGKTTLCETCVDLLLQMNAACLVWSPEWTPEEFVERAVQRYGGPSTDDLYYHEIFIDEKQRGVQKGFGRELTLTQQSAASTAVAKLRTFESHVGYLDMPVLTATHLQNALDNTLRSIDFKPRILVIDYIQLMAALEQGSSSMYDLLLRIKITAATYGLIPWIVSQVTKTSTKGQQNGKLLDAMDARYVNDDAFNLFITVNPDRDQNGDYYPSAVLNIVKNSKGQKGKVRLPVNWERLYFEDRLHSDQTFDDNTNLLVF